MFKSKHQLINNNQNLPHAHVFKGILRTFHMVLWFSPLVQRTSVIDPDLGLDRSEIYQQAFSEFFFYPYPT